MNEQNLRKGQRVSYEDTANPLREGTLTGIRISKWGTSYEVTWSNGETDFTDLRQAGWRLNGAAQPANYSGDRCETCVSPLFGSSAYAPLCGPCGRAVETAKAERQIKRKAA